MNRWSMGFSNLPAVPVRLAPARELVSARKLDGRRRSSPR